MMPEQTVEVPDHVIAREVSGEMVLMDLQSGTYFALDPIGARVWELLEQGLTLSMICDAIHAEYDAPRETIENDVGELCGDLLEKKLLVSVA